MAQNRTTQQEPTYFLGVGAQKAGTTWLSYYFKSHPDVMMCPIKEMHFWGNRENPEGWPIPRLRQKLADRKQQDAGNPAPSRGARTLQERIEMQGKIENYKKFFETRLKRETVFGEISPSYSFLPIAEYQTIRQEFPKSKIIFLLRNPVDRMWSQLRFSEKFDGLEDLKTCLVRAFDDQGYTKRSNYIHTITTLRQCFPENDLHFEFYERLFTPEAIARLCNFLNVPLHAADFSRTRNVSTRVILPPDLRQDMITKLASQYRFVADTFDGDLPDSWKKDIEALT